MTPDQGKFLPSEPILQEREYIRIVPPVSAESLFRKKIEKDYHYGIQFSLSDKLIYPAVAKKKNSDEREYLAIIEAPLRRNSLAAFLECVSPGYGLPFGGAPDVIDDWNYLDSDDPEKIELMMEHASALGGEWVEFVGQRDTLMSVIEGDRETGNMLQELVDADGARSELEEIFLIPKEIPIESVVLGGGKFSRLNATYIGDGEVEITTFHYNENVDYMRERKTAAERMIRDALFSSNFVLPAFHWNTRGGEREVSLEQLGDGIFAEYVRAFMERFTNTYIIHGQVDLNRLNPLIGLLAVKFFSTEIKAGSDGWPELQEIHGRVNIMEAAQVPVLALQKKEVILQGSFVSRLEEYIDSMI